MDRGAHRMRPERQLQHMTKMLNLNSQQQQRILPILQDRDRQMQTLWSNSSLAPQDRHAQMRAIMENSKNKLEAVLSDTQKQQYEEMMAKNRKHRLQHMQQMQMQQNGAPPPDSAQPNPPTASSGQAPQ